jgi:hypothetical protein
LLLIFICHRLSLPFRKYGRCGVTRTPPLHSDRSGRRAPTFYCSRFLCTEIER